MFKIITGIKLTQKNISKIYLSFPYYPFQKILWEMAIRLIFLIHLNTEFDCLKNIHIFLEKYLNNSNSNKKSNILKKLKIPTNHCNFMIKRKNERKFTINLFRNYNLYI